MAWNDETDNYVDTMDRELLSRKAQNVLREFVKNPALVSGAGAVVDAPALIAPDDYALAPSSMRAISLPNVYPAQPNHVVHPSLRVFKNGFGGYRFWLAYTPYPSANSDYENPCVVASNDLMTWSTPTANPLQPKPVGGYNADTHLFMSADGGTMYLAYRERILSGQNKVLVMSTTDGRSWTAPRTIASGATGTQDYASPSIWWNGTGWTMISHNLDATAPWPLQRSVSLSSDLFGGFGAPVAVTIAPLAGRSWWHSSFERLPSGQVVGLCQDNAGVSGSPGNVFWATSGDDGATCQVSAPISYTGGSRYRSCFALDGDVMHVLLGSLTDIDYYRGDAGRLTMLTQSRSQSAGLLAAAAIPGTALWADTFIRANSAASVGTASSGGAYTVSAGTWGISGNQAYPVASGRLLASVGTPNHRVQAQITGITAGVQQWVIGRGVDGANYWRAGIQNPSATGVQALWLECIVAGGISLQLVGIARCLVGDNIGLDFSGSRIQVLVNGQPVYEMQSATHAATGNSIGLQCNLGATSRYRNLVATAN